MREPSADRTFATPDDLPVSAVLPELLRSVREGQVVYLSEGEEPIAAVVQLEVAKAGLAARGRPDEGTR
ncbi:hypothetical protein ACNAW0_16725 [Micromonospora sp. SL1-18]|uniref:hypothetical protein n=1 Tax=Micromonospora sp. SL1-18 TaxID=3399128 RepID=UPI003A4D3AA8